VKEFKRIHGRFPRSTGDADERKLYLWLRDGGKRGRHFVSQL